MEFFGVGDIFLGLPSLWWMPRRGGVGLGVDNGELMVLLRFGCCVATLRDDDDVRWDWTLHVGFNFVH